MNLPLVRVTECCGIAMIDAANHEVSRRGWIEWHCPYIYDVTCGCGCGRGVSQCPFRYRQKGKP